MMQRTTCFRRWLIRWLSDSTYTISNLIELWWQAFSNHRQFDYRQIKDRHIFIFAHPQDLWLEARIIFKETADYELNEFDYELESIELTVDYNIFTLTVQMTNELDDQIDIYKAWLNR